MGNNQSMKKINFEDMQLTVKNSNAYLIINTLPFSEQKCLIANTLLATDEEAIINKYIINHKGIQIIIYGKNCTDDTVTTKYQQLYSLGFYNIFVYSGGLFEWLLLQDIYGKELFQTTSTELDLLKYKSPKSLHVSLLEY
jgi:hypothetical protein